jgi:hypothetical protein
LLNNFEQKRFELRGYRIYAIDGEYLQLPCSEQILEDGYRGVCLNGNKETHYPHMYITHAYDILSGITKDVRCDQKRQEIVDAIDMVGNFEKNSISLYDRYYISGAIIFAHKKAGNYFIARCKKNAYSKVKELFASDKKRSSMIIHGVFIQLIKVTNPKNNETIVYATNLPIGTFNKKEVAILYTRRWSIETLFRDSTVTHLKLEQWHSRSPNGILQELFTHYWLLNFCRIQITTEIKFIPEEFLRPNYCKPNFKWIMEIIVTGLPQIVRGKYDLLLADIQFAIKRSKENRTHLSRQYPRQIKTPQKLYQRAKAVPRRAPK